MYVFACRTRQLRLPLHVDGDKNVRYDIALRECEPFAVDFDLAMGQAFA